MAGTYGEGDVQNLLSQLLEMKQAVQAGKMSLVDYQAKSSPLVKQAATMVGNIANKGSAAASSVNPIWQQFQQEGLVTARGGQWVPTLPFNQQEYAKLPDNVLPQQSDVQKGLFDPNAAPMQRYQGGSNGISVPTAPTSGGSQLPQINPSIPNGVDTRTDQGQIALTGATNASTLQDAINKQLQVNQQSVGELGKTLAGIPDIYRQEGANQQAQLTGLADQQKSARAQTLSDLANVLATNQQNLFNRAVPDLAEQANTQGILRSTGFGDRLANKYTQLTQDTQSQLAQQGLSDREAYLSAQQNALNQGLGFSGQAAQAQAQGQQTIGSANAGALQGYSQSLGDVANTLIGANNAGLSRNFSLQDYAKQYSDALNLANAAKTQGPTGKASPGTQAWVQGSLGAINAGANVAKAGSGKAA